MKRRSFIQKGSLSALGAAAISKTSTIASIITPQESSLFHLNYAPHFGMFRNLAGEGLVDQLHYMADQGFMAMEDNEMKSRPVDEQVTIGKIMKERGMTMGVFVAHKIYWNQPNLASGDTTMKDGFLEDIKASIPVAKRVGAKWMTVVPGLQDLRKDMGYQTANVISTLREACKIVEDAGLIMVLEPLNPRDHPGLFLQGSAHAYSICKAVNHPSCKILFDIYHQQITEGNLLPNIEACWDEIAYFQIGDNPGRKEPTTGEINYYNIFRYIHSRGYKGVLGMEHGNSREGRQGELDVITAYRKVDEF